MLITAPLTLKCNGHFTHKREYLAQYQSDWATWLTETTASWTVTGMCLVDELAAWWKPLLAMAPTLRTAVAGNCLIRTDDEHILIDFAEGDVRPYNNEPIRYRLDIARPLLEGVVRQKAVDWSNSLFLSCRFYRMARWPVQRIPLQLFQKFVGGTNASR